MSGAKGLLVGHVKAFHILFGGFGGVSRKDQGKPLINHVGSRSRMRR
jgi:hypothetical protein